MLVFFIAGQERSTEGSNTGNRKTKKLLVGNYESFTEVLRCNCLTFL